MKKSVAFIVLIATSFFPIISYAECNLPEKISDRKDNLETMCLLNRADNDGGYIRVYLLDASGNKYQVEYSGTIGAKNESDVFIEFDQYGHWDYIKNPKNGESSHILEVKKVN